MEKFGAPSCLSPPFVLLWFACGVAMKPAWLLGFHAHKQIFTFNFFLVECSKLRVLTFPPLLSDTKRGITRNPDISIHREWQIGVNHLPFQDSF
jgi:hypothetical protein